MLDVKDIKKTFNKGTVNEKKALQGLSLHLNDGDFVTVIGGNGAGKSTMLNAIAGVWPVDSGTITIDDIDVTKQPEYKRAKYIERCIRDSHYIDHQENVVTRRTKHDLARAEERAHIGEGLKIAVDNIDAVSYTHLDVYKRQGYWS